MNLSQQFPLLCYFLFEFLAHVFSHAVSSHRLSQQQYQGNSENLLKNLFKHYDKRIRPFADNGSSVIVHMTIVLGILIELRENEQVAGYVISHTQRWKDPKLTWEPKRHNGITQLIVPQHMIWIPKMFVYNSMDTKDMLREELYDVRVFHNGDVKINIPQYVTCICRLNIDNFPFDTQYCAVALASPLLTVEEMDVVSQHPPKDSYFAGNSEWALINVTVRHMSFLEEGEYRAEVHYIFQLKRRPMFYITVIVVPIFLISALSILGIFTPGAGDTPRGEKCMGVDDNHNQVSLGLGSLLAMTVLLGIVAGAMPKSNSIPLLGYYILAVIILCAIAVAVSMAFLAISRKLVDDGRSPTPFIYRLALLNPKLLPKRKISMDSFRHIHYYYQDFQTDLNGTLNATSNGGSNGTVPHVKKRDNAFQIEDLERIHRLLSYLVDSQKNLKKKLEKEHLRNLIVKEWSRVFVRLDYLCLFIFQSLNIGSLVFFLQFAWAPPPEMRDPIV